MENAANNQKQQIQLAPGKEHLAPFEYMSTRHDCRIPMGVRHETLLQPEFWAHHGITLKPWDEIRARAEDGTWVSYLIVLDCSRTWARVKEISLHRLTTGDQADTQASQTALEEFIAAHTVKHRGPHGWSIVRNSDSATLEQNIGSREDANKRLREMGVQQLGLPAALAIGKPALAPA